MFSAIRKNPSTLIHFLLTIAGFGFWFLVAVPFALHRESYVWFTWAGQDSLARAAGTITATWRPLAQTATWLGFVALGPQAFPTSPLRQALLQGAIFALFAFAWWIIYRAATERRLLSVAALISGAVFFSGYIHLFHIYGLFYLPVLVILALMLKLYAAQGSRKGELVIAMFAVILVLWHPFATAIFLGFYFGRYLSTLTTLSRAQHVTSWTVLIVGAGSVLASLVLSPRVQQTFNPLGFVATYQTNEVNGIASLIAVGFALVTLFSMELGPGKNLLGAIGIGILASLFWMVKVPLILVWIPVGVCKLLYQRNWELAVPLVVAALLPYGAGIGAPVYALYAITLAVFVTPLGWTSGEAKLRSVHYVYAVGLLLILSATALSLRAGITVPLVSRFARPLLSERERTYQLEHALSWLASSNYCGYGVTFGEPSEDPVESVEKALDRRYRPPARLDEVTYYWERVLRCSQDNAQHRNEFVTITFGGQELSNSVRIFDLPGKVAGPATVWAQRALVSSDKPH